MGFRHPDGWGCVYRDKAGMGIRYGVYSGGWDKDRCVGYYRDNGMMMCIW